MELIKNPSLEEVLKPVQNPTRRLLSVRNILLVLFLEDEKVTAPRRLRSGNEWEDLAHGSPCVIFPVPLR